MNWPIILGLGLEDPFLWAGFDKSLPLSGLLTLSQRVNRRTPRVHSFHSGIARWSLLRYTVPNRAPIDIYFLVNHCYRCVSLGCLGCLGCLSALFVRKASRLEATLATNLKLMSVSNALETPSSLVQPERYLSQRLHCWPCAWDSLCP